MRHAPLLGLDGAALRRLQVASLVVPVVVGFVLAFSLWRVEHRAAEGAVLRNATLAAEFSERVLIGLDRLLPQADSLATPARLGSDPEGVVEDLAALMATDEDAVGLSVVTADGRFLVTNQTAMPVRDVSDRAYFRELRDGDWTVFVDRITAVPGSHDALVVARRRAGDTFGGVVVAATGIAPLTDFFGTLAGAPGDAASLIRHDGRILVRHDPDDAPMMIERPAQVFDVIAGRAPSVYEVTAQSDGVTRLYATLPVEGFPLVASFGMSTAAIWQAWMWRMLLVAAGLVAVAAICLVAIGELRRRRQQTLHAMALAESRDAAERQVTLYEELNHRVKNNLQFVESLLRLRGREQSDELRRILDDVASRVHAIGEVHQQLAITDNAATVDLATLLHRLAGSTGVVPPERGIEIRVRADSVEVPVARAIPLALLAVEALTNAAKHAFPDGRPGHIDVGLNRGVEDVTLTVADDGVGRAFVEPDGRGLGMRLMQGLARQLGATFNVRSNDGTQVVVVFPLGREASAGDAADAS